MDLPMNKLHEFGLSPRLRYDLLDPVESKSFFAELYESIERIRLKYSGAVIPNDVGVFANSYFHDSVVKRIEFGSGVIRISIELAAAIGGYKRVLAKNVFRGSVEFYDNFLNEFSVMDSRIQFLSDEERRLVMWLGHEGILVIRYTHHDVSFVSGKQEIGISCLQHEEMYGWNLLTSLNIDEYLNHVMTLNS